jgi:acyl carrier protein
MPKEKLPQVEKVLKDLITKCLRRDDFVLDPNSTFKDLGIDSLEVVHILVALEDSLDIEIVDEDLKSIKNMGALIVYLKQKVVEKQQK